ncbi:hypothetical protein [Lentzea albidocapillata]|uniref:Nephrocystin 3-like N-terminal domain-containing protein n=1 Tax=Lentzea albidocapillata TaxID=40571 RepID=A0A1W2C0Q5_9PSEU|nr:hypothetical protein [Lentzea albidocapillata]SMC78827.1 hypothetical protein SAMN05660733_01711 [Lentzea albidocapillata]
MAQEPGVAVRATSKFRIDVPVTRSAYLHQVVQIAPADLIGREHELAELAEFCTAPTTSGRYLWWRAEAWSGKTALLSSFVLDPPAGVRVVSFFITGRLSGQNDQTAFLDNVLEQLVTLMGAEIPDLLTETTKHAHVLRLLDAATAGCRSRDESFVLVVDGLDEDNGAGGHSIASLLPARLPDGMRVVVAGRPNPPADAPDDHPLRSGAAEIRALVPSPAAVAMRREAERELKALLHSNDLEKDLLGLICAAGGGLTAADLAELTETSPYETEGRLRSVAGRSFARRDNAYLLAHEELRVIATEMLGPRLTGYRDRLHAWADGYQDNGWPETTPDYLLHQYPPMLRSLPDPARLVELATDRARQARLLRRTGGDAAAHAEILATQQVMTDHDSANLLAITRLAATRGDLDAHNGSLPVELPAVWELLGQRRRAEALAHGFVNPLTRSEALSLLTAAITDSGDLDRAHNTANSITVPLWRALTFTDLALTVVGTGDDQRAGDVLREAEKSVSKIQDDDSRARALIGLAGVCDRLGQHDRAQTLLDEAEPETVGEFTLLTSELTRCSEMIGDSRRADRLVAAASEPLERAILLAEMSSCALARGNSGRATKLLDDAEALAAHLTHFDDQLTATAAITRSAADFPDRSSILPDLDLEVPEDVEDAGERDSFLLALVDCTVARGDLKNSERAARLISPSVDAAAALVEVAQLALTQGERERADAVIATLTSSHKYESLLGDLALHAAKLGETADAEVLAELAETISRRGGAPYREKVATDAVSALCSLGWYDDAEDFAATTSVTVHVALLTVMLASVDPVSEQERFCRIADAAVSLWRKTTKADSDKLSQKLAGALAAAGDAGRTTAVINSISDSVTQATATASAALAAAPVHVKLAVELALRAFRQISRLDFMDQLWPMSDASSALMIADDSPRTRMMISNMLTGGWNFLDRSTYEIAKASALAGHYERAMKLAEDMGESDRESVLGHSAAAMATAGLITDAQRIANTLEGQSGRDKAMFAITIAVAKTREWSLARSHVGSLHDGDTQAHLLGELAIVAADTGETAMAKRFVAEAVTTARWSVPLRALGRVDPDALRAMVACIRAGWSQPDHSSTLIRTSPDSR